jgi:hypothetical protein
MVQVAENNLAPLENNVNTKQAAFDAENQQYLSWERKMQVRKRAMPTAEEAKKSPANPRKEPC